MEKPIFIVVKKYFHMLCGYDVPFTPDWHDVDVYASYDEAVNAVMRWSEGIGHTRTLLIDVGELSRAAAQCDCLVYSLSVNNCYSRHFAHAGAEIFQKYVL